MVTTLEDLKKVVRDHWSELQSGYQVSRLGFFGSFARGEQTESSDVDVLVEFSKPIGLQFVRLADRLEQLLGRPVDLVTTDAIRANRRMQIMADLVNVEA